MQCSLLLNLAIQVFIARILKASESHPCVSVVMILHYTVSVTAFGPETHPFCLHSSFHPAATREPDGLCGNQRQRREFLTMGTMVPVTC